MCQFVGISPFGTDGFLRARLRQHLRQIKQDDYEIEQEGECVASCLHAPALVRLSRRVSRAFAAAVKGGRGASDGLPPVTLPTRGQAVLTSSP